MTSEPQPKKDDGNKEFWILMGIIVLIYAPQLYLWALLSPWLFVQSVLHI